MASHSEAAASIIESGAEVAGLSGFSGKETSVSAAWLEERVESGQIRWILSGGGMAGGPGGDTCNGSEEAIEAVTATCAEVAASELESSAGTPFDCGG